MPAKDQASRGHAAPADDADRLNHLAAALAQEFAAPIGLLDLTNRAWRMRMGARSDRFPAPEEVIAACRAANGQAHREAAVWRPASGLGIVWLLLHVVLTEAESLVAAVGFATGGEAVAEGDWGAPCPERALRAWGESVATRLNVAAGARDGHPSGIEAAAPSLLGYLAGRLRVSDQPEQFQKLAASKLRAALQVKAIAWMPSQRTEPPVVAGVLPAGASLDELRAWTPSGRELVRIVEEAPGVDGAGPGRLAVVAAGDGENHAGWLVAIHPRPDRPFSEAQLRLLRSVAALLDTQRTNARLYRDLHDMLFGVIHALTSAIDAKDPYTSGHSERVARIAVRLGAALGLSAPERGDLYLMGLLHDVGKIGIDDGVLKKPGPLSSEEYHQIQAHVRIGLHILADLTKLQHLLPGVQHHHERMDGSGYPAGLAGESIPLEARILAVADAFDAMSSSRPYRRRLAPRDIDEAFRKGSGEHWDPQVVRALFACRSDVERIQQKGLGASLNEAVNGTIRRPT